MSNKGGAKTTSSKTKKKDIIVKVDLARRETLSGKELEVWKQEQEKKLIKAKNGKKKKKQATRRRRGEETSVGGRDGRGCGDTLATVR